ncbi:MAG: hypothetical protein QF464_11250 [Myxococcota bacterium]|nr:hypothetical protein [Myxococcota bacterium]
MSTTTRFGDSLMAMVVKLIVGFTLFAAVLTHLIAGTGPFLWGVLAGGFLQVANLGALIWLGTRLTRAENRGVAFYVVLFVFKIALLIAVAIYLLKMFPIDAIGFMVGITLLMPASLVASAIQPASDEADAVEMKA